MLAKFKKVFPLATALAPLAMFAQTKLQDAAGTIQGILNMIVPIIMTLALIYFFWGLANYILSAGDEEKKGEGRNQMIYGVIALFVMAAVWGLVGVLSNTFGVDQGTAPTADDLLPNP